MTYPVTYYCPHCETLVELERDGYLADKAVTPFPFEGWTYVAPDEDYEAAYEAGVAEGVKFVCGADGTLKDPDAEGCGEPFYLSFVRFEDGREVDPRADSERVRINPDPRNSGPRSPDSPSGPDTDGF